MAEKRRQERKTAKISTLVRKGKVPGGQSVMEFYSKDVSLGGIFICTEDLSVLELGDEIEILVDAEGEKYYEGRARVVRSARVFSDEGVPMDSGFGVMFLDPEKEFLDILAKQLEP
jgi:hypothetical protein